MSALHTTVKVNGMPVDMIDYKNKEGTAFDLVNMSGQTWSLFAENTEDRSDWVDKIKSLIESSLEGRTSSAQRSMISTPSMSPREDFLAKLYSVPGNEVCADCGKSKRPKWASVNLGVLICIKCSGIHRKLGSHIGQFCEK